MSLVLAFGLTALFFVVIWLLAIATRVIGIRRRIEGLDRAIIEAQTRVEHLSDQIVGEAAFATAPIQSRDLAALISLLRRSGDPQKVEQASILADLDRALAHVRSERERAELEQTRLIAHPIAAFIGRHLAKK